MVGDSPAWVEIPSEEEVRAAIPPGRQHPLDFGFLPSMTRLIAAHERIEAPLRALTWEVMFAPAGMLERRERELLAAVSSAAQDCYY